MTREMPIVQARKDLTRLPEQFEREPEAGAVAVTRRGRPVLAIMSWEFYEAIVETLEIMGDEDLLKALKEEYSGRADIVFVHVHKEQVLALRFGIQSIPVQVFFDAEGREVFRHEGFFSREDILQKLQEMGVK